MTRIAIALATVLLVAGCGGGETTGRPAGGADYSGAVVQVGDGAVLVRAAGDSCGIWVSPADPVSVTARSGGAYDEASWSDLRPGVLVDLWIPGGIAESCPMQGAAEAVVIVEPAPA